MRHPRLVPKKARSKVSVSSIDVAPTILDLVSHGRSVGRRTGTTFGADGASLVPILEALRSNGGGGSADDGDDDDNDGTDGPSLRGSDSRDGNGGAAGGGSSSGAISDGGDEEEDMDGRATISTDGGALFSVRTKMHKLVWNAARSRVPAGWGEGEGEGSQPGPAAGAAGSSIAVATDTEPWHGAALFDLYADPHESRSIITEAASKDNVKELLAVLHDYWDFVGYRTAEAAPGQ